MIGIQETVEKLRLQGFKITPQRLAILKALAGNTSHPTAEAIYELIRRDHPTMSFNTVYKTLEVLEEIGEVAVLDLGEGKKHFDPDMTPHHHVVCRQCRKVLDVHDQLSAAFSAPEHLKNRYAIDGCQVKFFGLCEDCAGRPSATS